MSQPVDPYRDAPRPRHGDQQYGGQHQHGGQHYGEPQYGGQPRHAGPYGDPYGAQPPGGQPYGRQPQYGQPGPPTAAPAWPAAPAGPGRSARPAPPAPPARPSRRPGPAGRPFRRFLGVGLVLLVLAVVVQLVSLTVLPLARLDGGEQSAASMPELWRIVTDQGIHGFGGWYVVLFSYPLAALSILLGLASVLESAALKVIWGGLALVGLGVLVLRYGLGPFTRLADGGGLDFSTQEITTASVALAALVVVIFVLRTAVATFRRVAGLILLGLGGVHLAAVWDLLHASGAEQLSVGAFGPAVGYLLTAAAAFVGPHRLIRP